MADENKRPRDRRGADGAARGDGPRAGGPRKPAQGGAARAGSGKGGAGKPWTAKPSGSGGAGKGGAGRPDWKKRGDAKTSDRASGSRPARSGPPREEDARPRHDDPVVPEDVAANQLDRAARAELKTLSKDNADWVAKHLVMAGRLIDTDAALAHRHALAAARRAGRIGVVRETTAITAYATGDFALALRELRTYRRITGLDDQLPLMVDSERGVGRPQQALELGRSVPRASLEPAVQASLAIAMSGARLDLGQPELALSELEIPQLDPEVAYSYSPALFDAYATVLEELGRTEEAEQWWARSERASVALEEAATPEGQDTIEIVEEGLDENDVTDAPEGTEA
jgi:hypothetical protein